jgi:integrase
MPAMSACRLLDEIHSGPSRRYFRRRAARKWRLRLQGHPNLSTTADIYTHTTDESEREAAVALERAIFGDLFSTVLNSENKNRKAATQ